jgi:phospholipid/cholesterol/gamma-HCH transport system substrate-binding protein
MKPEKKVGLLFIAAIALVAGFAYVIGAVGPFNSSHELTLLYNFAGGIEVGSPVRVMGIKVGKVKSIDFDPNMKTSDGEEVKLKIRISVDQKAWQTLRQDSKFFINLAGVIGEKFLEATPGSTTSAELTPNAVIRGEDPPRIDQLISQSYGLAGKILSMVEKNEGSVTNTLQTMNTLVTNLNKTLVMVDKLSQRQDTQHLIGNLVQITGDVATVTKRFRGPEADKTLDLLHELLWRLKDLDQEAIKKFFQKEGVKAKIF